MQVHQNHCNFLITQWVVQNKFAPVVLVTIQFRGMNF